MDCKWNELILLVEHLVVTNDGCTLKNWYDSNSKPTKVSTPVTICSGETYKWAVNERLYTVGTYLVTNDGCTANQNWY
jgi:hypothetical protein